MKWVGGMCMCSMLKTVCADAYAHTFFSTLFNLFGTWTYLINAGFNVRWCDLALDEAQPWLIPCTSKDSSDGRSKHQQLCMFLLSLAQSLGGLCPCCKKARLCEHILHIGTYLHVSAHSLTQPSFHHPQK